jgi:hypothetical protein
MPDNVTSTLLIDGPIDKVFALMADVLFIQSIHCAVGSVELLSTNNTGLNASRKVIMLDKHSMEETVTEYEVNKSIRYKASAYKAPMYEMI